MVNHSRNDFFSGTTFTKNQNSDVLSGDSADLAIDLLGAEEVFLDFVFDDSEAGLFDGEAGERLSLISGRGRPGKLPLSYVARYNSGIKTLPITGRSKNNYDQFWVGAYVTGPTTGAIHSASSVTPPGTSEQYGATARVAGQAP